MANETAHLPEYIFIAYDGVIKNYRPALLKKILSEQRTPYEPYIDIERISSYNDKRLMGLAIQSLYPNILQYLAVKEFDYDAALMNLYQLYPSLYLESDLLSMGDAVKILVKQKFTSKIYIWTPEYDKRIHFDIQALYTDMEKVEYITGPFSDVLNTIEDNITTYMINDVHLLTDMIALDKVTYSNILVAEYGYNYKEDDKGNLVLDIADLENKIVTYGFKIATFIPTHDCDFGDN